MEKTGTKRNSGDRMGGNSGKRVRRLLAFLDLEVKTLSSSKNLSQEIIEYDGNMSESEKFFDKKKGVWKLFCNFAAEKVAILY